MTTLRSYLSPIHRQYVHAVAVAVLGFITAITHAEPAVGALVVALVIAVFDLGVALANSTNGVRSAIYGLALACQPLAVFLHFGSDAQWGPALALVAAILGGGLAAAKTPAE